MCSYDNIFCKNYKRYFNCHHLTGHFYSDFTCIVCHISFHDLLNIIIFVGEADMRIHRVWVQRNIFIPLVVFSHFHVPLRCCQPPFQAVVVTANCQLTGYHDLKCSVKSYCNMKGCQGAEHWEHGGEKEFEMEPEASPCNIIHGGFSSHRGLLKVLLFFQKYTPCCSCILTLTNIT